MGEIVGKLRALASVLSTRSSIASAAGVTFAGERDLFTTLGYKLKLEPKDFRERYQRNAIAGRIVEALPKATWRSGLEIVEDDDPDIETTFETAVVELNRKLNLWMSLLRADILAGLGRYSVLLIGAPGELDTELPKTGEILYMSPFSEEDAVIDTLISDSSDPRFGLPETYKFKRISADASGRSQEKVVHWSRVIHVADGVLDEQIYGEPRLKRCWNLLDDLEKVTGAGAEAFWLRAHQGFQLNVDPEVEMDTGDMTALQDEADEFIHGMRRFIRTKGVTLKALGSDVANFANQVDAILTQISGGTGIPKRILVGSEMGEMASTQDRSNWQERVDDRRQQYAGPHVVVPLVDRLIEYNYLPTPLQYDVRWPEIQDMDNEERAIIADKLSKLNKQVGGTVITPAEIRDRILQLPPLPEEEEEEYDEPESEEEPVNEEPEEDETLEEEEDGLIDSASGLRISASKKKGGRPSARLTRLPLLMRKG